MLICGFFQNFLVENLCFCFNVFCCEFGFCLGFGFGEWVVFCGWCGVGFWFGLFGYCLVSFVIDFSLKVGCIYIWYEEGSLVWLVGFCLIVSQWVFEVGFFICRRLLFVLLFMLVLWVFFQGVFFFNRFCKVGVGGDRGGMCMILRGCCGIVS